MKVSCGNCSWKGDDSECDFAKDITERHDTGVVYSSAECPKCGSLCYPTAAKHQYPWGRFVMKDDHDKEVKPLRRALKQVLVAYEEAGHCDQSVLRRVKEVLATPRSPVKP